MKSKNIMELNSEFNFDDEVFMVAVQINGFLEKEGSDLISFLSGNLDNCNKSNRMKNFSEREKIIYFLGVLTALMTK